MSKYLCTFSGKYGDILWSLATAKRLAERIVNSKVDFAVMPYYEPILPMLASQSYIDHAFVIKDWVRTHSNHGDQPWQPPQVVTADGKTEVKAQVRHETEDLVGDTINTYDRVWHLTYKGHPGITAASMPLIDFIAYQQGVGWGNEPCVPFLTATDHSDEFAKIELTLGNCLDVMRQGRLISYAFNEQYADQKKVFFESLYQQTEGLVEFFNIASLTWPAALYAISMSKFFVGCRSANWVLAMGLKKQTITYEPHPARHQSGNLGLIFSCPYGLEIALPFMLPPDQCAKMVADVIKEQMKKAEVR